LKRLIITAIAVLELAPALPMDRAGTTDMPILARYEGSVIVDQGVKAFDRVEFTTRVLPNSKFESTNIEGRRVWTVLQGPSGRSGLEVFLNYQRAIDAQGFKTLYTCSRTQCNNNLLYDGMGGMRNEVVGAMGRAGDGSIDDVHYLVAQRSTPNGTDTVRLAVRGPKLPVALVDVVQSAAMEQRVAILAADDIARQLMESGKAALYAIYFDTDSAVIKPESKPQLAELASYLRSSASVRVYIVGHTDARGTVEYNNELSKRRAEAVADALKQQYSLAGDRATAFGVGELAPLASNDTDAGRSKNRRVEIVKRLD
jgi:outer membrane protein OmpA-like peptidoglycan-associated protein